MDENIFHCRSYMSNMTQKLIVTLMELGKCCLLFLYIFKFSILPNFPLMISVCSKEVPCLSKAHLNFRIKKKEFRSVSVMSDCLQPHRLQHARLPHPSHQLLEFIQTHVHQVGDAIQPSHPLSSPSPPALNLSQHQGLFK